MLLPLMRSSVGGRDETVAAGDDCAGRTPHPAHSATKVISSRQPSPASPPSLPLRGEGKAERARLEMDIVSRREEVLRLLLRITVNVLEQLYSPLIVHTTPEHAELKAICSSGRESLILLSVRADSRRLLQV